jgi:hypothetical protein|tara:strand:+ start:2060 stop:2659 length:600 start_codon:yes stop_codon:yes gene_type:complete
MSFKKNDYKILKKVLPKEFTRFIFNYFILKRQIAATLSTENAAGYRSPFVGRWDDPQVPNTYSHYGEPAMETLLWWLKPTMEKATNLKLIETYSYARIYNKGSILKKHTDRESCEISTTLNLGGDTWPIYLEKNKQKIEVNLLPGDMLIYRGCKLKHWRYKFKGNCCAQVFLHYNKKDDSLANKYDGRPHLGLPSRFKK